MGRVKRLADNVINKIAAGEVIERPASVAKELVENAVDAGATDISIEVRVGGKSLIRVRDNGHGMSGADALLALERHSTSKISEAEELHSIRTMGFRGEALPSIASVSRLVLTTKEPGALAGTRVTVTGGAIEETRETGAPNGTELSVSDLFFNTPARLKFLKTDRTEIAHIADVVTCQALARPGTAFSLVSDGDELIKAPVAPDPRQRVADLFGSRVAGALVPVATEGEGFALTGLVGSTMLSRRNRTGQYFFINGRPVRERLLNYAVGDAYGSLLPPGYHPYAFLFLEIDPGEVDINVHPTKREVRFTSARRVRAFVQGAVAEALRGADLSPRMEVGREPAVIGEGVAPYAAPLETVAPGSPAEGDLLPWDGRGAAAGVVRERGYRAVGQAKNLYIVCECPEGLAIIDQHAAHERVLFERVMRLYREGASERQMLLEPELLELSAAEFVVARGYLELLDLLGFGVEEFGGNAMKIDSLPASLPRIDARGLLRDVIGELAGEGRVTALDAELAELVAKKVCRAAVKKRDPLKREELQALVDDLFSCETPYSCPHGRPTVITLTAEELEKKFGRT